MKQLIAALVALTVVAVVPLAAAMAENDTPADGQPTPAQAKAILKRTRPLAEQGSANAQYNMGVLYDQGYGVPQNYTKARNWYEKAAAQGYAKAEHNLGILYEAGKGVPKNAAKAAQWFKRAAAGGEPASQNNLAVMYARGEGVPQDLGKAALWAARAAAAGNGQAEANLPDITAGLPQSKINGNQVNVRAQPKADAEVVSQAENSASVVVLDRRNRWSQVLLSDDDTVGWVADSLLAGREPANGQVGGQTGEQVASESSPARSPIATNNNPDNTDKAGHPKMPERVARMQAPAGQSDNGRPAPNKPAPADTKKPATPEQPKKNQMAQAAGGQSPPPDNAKSQKKNQTASPPAQKNSSDVRVVAADIVNLRRKHSRQAEVIIHVHRGDKVTVLRRYKGWRYVKLADGKRGWIAGYLLIKP